MSNELNYISGLFNEKVLDKLYPIIFDIDWSISLGNSLFSKNSKIEPKKLIHLDDYSLSIYLSDVLIQEEIQKFLTKIKNVKNITDKKSLSVIVESIYKFYKVKKVSKIVEKYADNIDILISKISEIPVSISTPIDVVTLGEIIPSKLIEEEGGNIILPSVLTTITNNLYHRGFLAGELIGVTGAPGKGKSAYMNFEAANLIRNGYKGLWIAMGDLTKVDIVNRLTSVLTDTEYFKVISAPDKYFESIRDIALNFDVVTAVAGELSSEDIISLSESKLYDFVVVDYDSQVKQENFGDNMYLQGGKLYEDLSRIAKNPEKKKVLFVGSQISKFYWNHEIVPEEAMGESTRKQHHLDTIITVGRSISDHHCGFFNLAKVRRGREGISWPYRMTNSGIFLEIEKSDLSMLKRYDGDKK